MLLYFIIIIKMYFISSNVCVITICCFLNRVVVLVFCLIHVPRQDGRFDLQNIHSIVVCFFYDVVVLHLCVLPRFYAPRRRIVNIYQNKLLVFPVRWDKNKATPVFYLECGFSCPNLFRNVIPYCGMRRNLFVPVLHSVLWCSSFPLVMLFANTLK